MMNDWVLYILLGLLILHVILATLLSREVLIWVPSWRRKLKLWALIWLIPYWGLKWANRNARLGWNEERYESAGTSSVEMGFMLIDAIYNPGARHRIEAVQEHKVKVAKKNDQDKDDVDDDLAFLGVKKENKND